MEKNEQKRQYVRCIGEIEKFIVEEKGEVFWNQFISVIEQSQRENFIEGYRYAIKLLEESLIVKE